MARGWESKSVEEQMDAAEQRARERATPQFSAEEIAAKARRDSLLLDRKRIEQDLARARHPRHREMLQQALAHLDARLAE
ncbi:MAG: hypothetical protein SFV51_08640 [Bryobacteraceae bacterium]|nr:hypothetical protein [Bryobacteraceae bacterium]